MNFQTTIFRCTQNYVSPTRVTRSKFAPNMADPTSIKHAVSNLKIELLYWRLGHCKLFCVDEEATPLYNAQLNSFDMFRTTLHHGALGTPWIDVYATLTTLHNCTI